MRLLRLLILILIGLSAATPALAVRPDEMLKNPVLEARARALSKQLRCMVCQNESIDASEAPLAHDIRVLVRQRIKAGDTNQQVINFLVSRYGDFILLKPPFNWKTALLWLLSPLLLVIGALSLWPLIRRARSGAPGANAAPLTAAEQQRLNDLLGGGETPQSAPGSTTTN